MREALFFVLCRCSWASEVWVESPDEISSKFWRSLLHPPPPPPGEWQQFVWNRSASISIFFFLSTYFLFFLSSFLSISHPHHQHLYTDIPSGKSSLPSAALEHTLFHAWSWHAHPWCDLTWSLQRHHLFSQQFPHFTICMSLRSPEHLPASLQSLKGMTTEHDQALGLMSCRDMGRGLKMEWERHEH